MAANVVFSVAAAQATWMDDATLAERAHAAYLESPGLPSNQITRQMALHLGLTILPSGAARSRDCIISGPTGVTRRTVSAAPAIRAGLLQKPYRQSLADTV
jgi:hypothetical protein